ncbi:c-type cytochrome [Blastomonas fulva]|uniref:c-type cytochrome n=1 Tax=Blastomonas fulva TaxID=1550728 RepID=UPI0025A4315F|nr:cytochrome c family protein [Blastomonas fulva]MDM7929934.1 cytochrome c family protein [Blastomonas fulva]MDM7966301.1 cytochrome c family protein [Blastomonas fulva]
MQDNKNTIAGWALAGGIAALGLSIISGKVFHADKPERPEKLGYVIEGVVSSEGEAAAEVPIATLLASADVAKGEKVFAKCSSCHSINSGGANGIGPNLYGVMGKPHASVAGFAYSDALKSKSGPWTFEEMNKWLTSPKAYADGTKMSFAGLGKAEDRANLMAWMNTQTGSPLPLPAAPAPDAAADEALAAEGGAAPAAADGAATPAADAAAAPAAG